MSFIGTMLRKVDRTPCKRCGCVAALHVGTRCYGATEGGRCDCAGLIIGKARDERLGWFLCFLVAGLLGLAMGGF